MTCQYGELQFNNIVIKLDSEENLQLVIAILPSIYPMW